MKIHKDKFTKKLILFPWSNSFTIRFIFYFAFMKRKSPEEFRMSLSFPEPPDELSLYERALWYAGKGKWKNAHEIVQDMHDQPSAQIHAFLHRQEGDISNAKYWYEKAGTRMPSVSLDKEWDELVVLFLGDH